MTDFAKAIEALADNRARFLSADKTRVEWNTSLALEAIAEDLDRRLLAIEFKQDRILQLLQRLR
ncbi:hypothetical protein QO002_005430 [Pararhizobium capsulatum DSM 1112]|uniref:Uncharacterized protein n=1 Tax=Pararhizobium capsulatum DSM 1112 TaxID=1121113 RepID=A0ABU0BY90_9HYPH|nr:hypothetical protein [Pararhizobium capsulatum]MDQ0323224.1 hypothetical protein [Pararhizobium capsulatum DSM 1112]